MYNQEHRRQFLKQIRSKSAWSDYSVYTTYTRRGDSKRQKNKKWDCPRPLWVDATFSSSPDIPPQPYRNYIVSCVQLGGCNLLVLSLYSSVALQKLQSLVSSWVDATYSSSPWPCRNYSLWCPVWRLQPSRPLLIFLHSPVETIQSLVSSLRWFLYSSI